MTPEALASAVQRAKWAGMSTLTREVMSIESMEKDSVLFSFDPGQIQPLQGPGLRRKGE